MHRAHPDSSDVKVVVQMLRLRGASTRDADSPDANGRPHYSTAAGGHLYYSTTGKWFLNSDEFAPDKATCHAAFATIGAVPVGEAVWRYWDGDKWVVRPLQGVGLVCTVLSMARKVSLFGALICLAH